MTLKDREELWGGSGRGGISEGHTAPTGGWSRGLTATSYPLSSFFKPSFMGERPCEGRRFLLGARDPFLSLICLQDVGNFFRTLRFQVWQH